MDSGHKQKETAYTYERYDGVCKCGFSEESASSENPHLQTPSYRSLPTTLYNTNTLPSDTYTADSSPTTYNLKNTNKN